jgi:hypothetical protein
MLRQGSEFVHHCMSPAISRQVETGRWVCFSRALTVSGCWFRLWLRRSWSFCFCSALLLFRISSARPKHMSTDPRLPAKTYSANGPVSGEQVKEHINVTVEHPPKYSHRASGVFPLHFFQRSVVIPIGESTEPWGEKPAIDRHAGSRASSTDLNDRVCIDSPTFLLPTGHRLDLTLSPVRIGPGEPVFPR